MRTRTTNFLTTIALLAPLAAVHAAPASLAVSPSDAGHVGAFRGFQDADGPRVRLENGREYRLIPLTANEKQRAIASAENAPATATRSAAAPGTPDIVDHRQFHGPIRDQADRGTCTSFAVAAALEGAYRRLDPVAFRDLDLSEQWINHVQKMVDRRRTTTADQMETAMGSWGGSYEDYLTLVLYRYGATEEAVMRYNPTAQYEAIGQEYADEDSNPLPTAKQRTADDFNLDPERLPLTALEKAPYRPTSGRVISKEKMQDPAFLESVVAAGYDIIFGIIVVDTEYTEEGVWTPKHGGEVLGGHSMLIVGYNRTKQYFIVRNQWGPDPHAKDGGYAHISYDYFRKYADLGVYITGVADPRQTSHDNLWLRRWGLRDGGKVDIYRLPDTASYADPREKDYRVGTYFTADGSVYRINGYLDKGQLVIFINRDNPNLDPSELSGDQYRLQLSDDAMSWSVVK
jgi:papain like protease